MGVNRDMQASKKSEQWGLNRDSFTYLHGFKTTRQQGLCKAHACGIDHWLKVCYWLHY